jgi:hypothetical protein
MDQHPNDVLDKDGWRIVRNEKYHSGGGGEPKKLVWYKVYHNHPGVGGLYTTEYGSYCTNASNYSEIVNKICCSYCDEQAPAVVDGFMEMIKWSQEHAD